jgi:hypothetical protein
MIEIKIEDGRITAIQKMGFPVPLFKGQVTKFETQEIGQFKPFKEITTIHVETERYIPANGRCWSPDGGYININDGVGIFDDGSKVDFNKGEFVRLSPNADDLRRLLCEEV